MGIKRNGDNAHFNVNTGAGRLRRMSVTFSLNGSSILYTTTRSNDCHRALSTVGLSPRSCGAFIMQLACTQCIYIGADFYTCDRTHPGMASFYAA